MFFLFLFFSLKFMALPLLIFIWHSLKPEADSEGLSETGLIQTRAIT